MNDEVFPFKLGTLDCLSVIDGAHVYEASSFFVNASQEEWEPLLRPYSDDPTKAPGPYTCLAVRTGTRWLLIDTGLGGRTPAPGQLLRNLRLAGINTSDVETVILTHGHPDHIGGNLDDDGRPVFPNARWIMGKDEWEFLTSDAELERLPAGWAACARRNLPPLQARLQLVDGDQEVAPGVRTVAAPGHTVGHLAVTITSGGERLLYTSDTALHPVSLARPDWYNAFDADRELAALTRRTMMDRAAADHTLVHAFHFPFPSLGYVQRHGAGWQWLPVAQSTSDPATIVPAIGAQT
jgi:glyoxylase-like metal-dependent hydrolase (beta-lactamase superfamily II)